MLHREKYGFGWEDTNLEFKYLIRFSTHKKQLKRNKHGEKKGKKLFLDESRV